MSNTTREMKIMESKKDEQGVMEQGAVTFYQAADTRWIAASGCWLLEIIGPLPNNENTTNKTPVWRSTIYVDLPTLGEAVVAGGGSKRSGRALADHQEDIVAWWAALKDALKKTDTPAFTLAWDLEGPRRRLLKAWVAVAENDRLAKINLVRRLDKTERVEHEGFCFYKINADTWIARYGSWTLKVREPFGVQLDDKLFGVVAEPPAQGWQRDLFVDLPFGSEIPVRRARDTADGELGQHLAKVVEEWRAQMAILEADTPLTSEAWTGNFERWRHVRSAWEQARDRQQQQQQER